VDELCRVYNPDYLGDDDGKIRFESKAEEGREEREPTHHAIDCHDFAEDDTIMQGDSLAGCVSRKEQVSVQT